MEFRQERLIPRTVHSQNVVDRIVARELYGNSGTDVRRRVVRGPPAAAGAARRATLDTNRAFYTNVFPGFTIVRSCEISLSPNVKKKNISIFFVPG